jgi:hypothetical protein
MQYFGMNESMGLDQLTENILGVVHNMKSALMAVNGYIELLAPEKTGEIYEHAKHSTGTLETAIENLVFALRAYRNTEAISISLNQCLKSAIELIRSNPTFRGKVKFTLELTENDIIHAVPVDVMTRLASFISGEAKRALAGGAYKLTVGTVNKSGNVFVRIGSAEITFPNSTA